VKDDSETSMINIWSKRVERELKRAGDLTMNEIPSAQPPVQEMTKEKKAEKGRWAPF